MQPEFTELILVISSIGVILLVLLLVSAPARKRSLDESRKARHAAWLAKEELRKIPLKPTFIDSKEAAEWRATLNESLEYDLVELTRNGCVHPTAAGYGIKEIKAQLTNMTDKRLNVVIVPGTYFVAHSGEHQNMIVYAEHRLRMHPRWDAKLSLPVACLDALLPVPSGVDRFNGVSKAHDHIVRFTTRARGQDWAVIQAGLWAMRPNFYTAFEIQQRLTTRGVGGSSLPAISREQIAVAKNLLGELRIDNRL